MLITLDDNSPSLQYVALNASIPWTHDILEATMGDSRLDRYFQGSMTRTTGEGNYMTFTFNGTAVAIYGAKRYNHGVYSVSLDGGPPLLQSGGKTDEEFQALLFRQDDLDKDVEHTVVITNLPSRSPPLANPNEAWYLDIDYVNIKTAPFGSDMFNTRIDDTSPDCVYQGNWAEGPSAYQDRYYNTTAHFSNSRDSSVTCSFNGSSVQMLGGLYPDHGNYSVSIDGVDPVIFNGTLYAFDFQIPLYTASSLDDGPHTITMTNLEEGRVLDIDYLLVNSTIKPGSSPAPGNNVTDPADSTTTDTQSSTPIGAIIGGAVGGSLFTILLALLAWFLWRKHKRAKNQDYAEKPSLDLIGDEVRPFRNSTTPPADSPYSELHPSTSTSYHSPEASAPYLTMIPPPPPSSNASYPALSPDQSRQRFDSARGLRDANPPSAFDANRTSHQVPSDAGTFGQPRSTIPPARQVKGSGAALPFTARRPSTLASSEDYSLAQVPSRRMVVSGRESDAGPLPLSPTSDESHEMGVLPPDYHQATEPLPGQVSRPSA